MSPDTQRIAIAEAYGMKWCRIGTDEHPYRMLCHWNPVYTPADGTEPVCNLEYMWEHGRIPDFLNDANAMTRAEESHPHLNWPIFIRNLAKIVRAVVDFEEEPDTGDFWLILHATPAQRAEAFLRSLNLYTSP